MSRSGLYYKPVSPSKEEVALRHRIDEVYLSKRALEHKIYPYLLRNVTAQYPHHIWEIDIIYIQMLREWLYLVAIID